jgi:hypothetical protein
VVGGLVGLSEVTGIVNGCYSSGSVSGNREVGGLAGGGLGGWGPITNSFWDVETSGQAESAGGEGKTTAEMQMANTFLNAGWDFVDRRRLVDFRRTGLSEAVVAGQTGRSTRHTTVVRFLNRGRNGK